MYIKNGEITIHYETFGYHQGGPTLVLVFGFSMSIQDWVDFGYVDKLEKHFKLVAIEPRGHGRSSCPIDPSAYQLDFLVSDVRTVIEHLNLPKAVIWGYSLGAKIALALSESFSDKISGLVLGGCELHSFVDLSNDIVTDTLMLGGIAWRDLWQQLFEVPKNMAERLTQVNTNALLSLRKVEKDWPSLAGIPQKITSPVLLYAGELCFSRDDMRTMSRLFVNSELMEMKGANHFELMPAVDWIGDAAITHFSKA
ncbi:alpha/beta fold hydrolase [Paenibacillus lautus]|uniref:alpha/beta fold hydrolase n=1 Tax=Paenibacillus lautus TaxID=1401 RepID=UPI003D2C1C38